MDGCGRGSLSGVLAAACARKKVVARPSPSSPPRAFEAALITARAAYDRAQVARELGDGLLGVANALFDPAVLKVAAGVDDVEVGSASAALAFHQHACESDDVDKGQGGYPSFGYHVGTLRSLTRRHSRSHSLQWRSYLPRGC